MVEFEEIKDEHYEENDGFEDEEDGSDGDYSDASDDDQGQDEDVQDETIIDRIVALKDIIPAHQRDAISRSISKAYSFGSMATFIGGKAVYILITSILMLGIPYALSLEEDKMISEQERQLQLAQGMSEVPSILFFDRRLISRFLRPPLPRLWLPRLQNLSRKHRSDHPVSEHSEGYLGLGVGKDEMHSTLYRWYASTSLQGSGKGELFAFRLENFRRYIQALEKPTPRIPTFVSKLRERKIIQSYNMTNSHAHPRINLLDWGLLCQPVPPPVRYSLAIEIRSLYSLYI